MFKQLAVNETLLLDEALLKPPDIPVTRLANQDATKRLRSTTSLARLLFPNTHIAVQLNSSHLWY